MIQSTDKKLEKGIEILGDIKKDTSTMLDKQDMMLEKQDRALEKQDTMLDKQDLMLGSQESMLGKQDIMIQKQDNTITAIREESKITRDTISQEFRELESQIKR